MKDLYLCKACGFTSIYLKSYTHFKGIFVCLDCKKDYGVDENVTRWIDEKLLNKELGFKS